MTDKQNLIDELQRLLKKHNASISWRCHFSSDLHGVTGEFMEISNGKGGTVLKIEGGTVSAYEIEQSKEAENDTN